MFPKPRRKSIARNRYRAQLNHEIQFSGGTDHDHYVREAGCQLALLMRVSPSPSPHHCTGSIQAAHLVSRGAGGRWWQVVGLCDAGHREQEAGRLHEDVIAWLHSRARIAVEAHLRSLGAI